MISSGVLHNSTDSKMTCMIEWIAMRYDIPPGGSIRFVTSKGSLLRDDDHFEISVSDGFLQIWLTGSYQYEDFTAIVTDADGREEVAKSY